MLAYFVALANRLTQLRSDDRGVTSVEYGLMVTLIAVAIIFTVAAVGGALNGLFTTVANTL